MASAVVEVFLGISGLTLTVDLYPLGSDTLGTTVTPMTEATNRKGLYTGTTAAALTGEFQAFIKSGSTVVGLGYVQMDNTTNLHRIVDAAATADISGTSVQEFARIAGAAPIPANAAQINSVPTTNVVAIGAYVGNATAAIGVSAGGKITEVVLTDTTTTVTNAVVLPTIPNNWIAAAGIAANALNGKGDWLLSSSYTAPDNADIATTLTNLNALITTVGVAGAGLTAVAQASTALSTANWTTARAAKLDNLDTNVGSRLATSGYTAPDNADIVVAAAAATSAAASASSAATSAAAAASSSSALVTTVGVAGAGLTALMGSGAMPEGYAANGATATPYQMLYMIYAAVQNFKIVGTSIEETKLDGVTVAMTCTIDSATTPTQRIRTS